LFGVKLDYMCVYGPTLYDTMT